MEINKVQLANILSNIYKPTVVALEGNICSGKSTYSKLLADSIDATVLSVDDFYLPHYKRTEEQMSKAGGNIDFDSLSKAIRDLINIKSATFSKYDCHKLTSTDVTLLLKGNILIVEGVYSAHPQLAKLIDIIVYMPINKQTQMQRLRLRNLDNIDDYINFWLLREDEYYFSINIEQLAHYIIS